MKICLVSDTHLRHKRSFMSIPDCDLLIHAGDACLEGTQREVSEFFAWFAGWPVRHKVFVAGNHDKLFEKFPDAAKLLIPPGVTYLQDSEAVIEGLRIYGAPWQPEFQGWSFNLPRGRRLREKWNLIPTGLDILVTHGPPMGVLDWSYFSSEHVGCRDLMNAVKRVKPRLHVFGHIHGGYGVVETPDTLFVNASMCDESYSSTRDPVVLEVTKEKIKIVSGGKPPVREKHGGMDPLWTS